MPPKLSNPAYVLAVARTATRASIWVDARASARASAHASANGDGVAVASAFAGSGDQDTTFDRSSPTPFFTFESPLPSFTSQVLPSSSFVEPQVTIETIIFPSNSPASLSTHPGFLQSTTSPASVSATFESFPPPTTTATEALQTLLSASSSPTSEIIATVTVTNSFLTTALPTSSPSTQTDALTQSAKTGLGVGLSLGLLSLLFLLALTLWKGRRSRQVTDGSVGRRSELDGTVWKDQRVGREELSGDFGLGELPAHYKVAELAGQ